MKANLVYVDPPQLPEQTLEGVDPCPNDNSSSDNWVHDLWSIECTEHNSIYKDGMRKHSRFEEFVALALDML